MEMENRRRALEWKRRKRARQRQLRRRMLAGGLMLTAVCVAVGTVKVRSGAGGKLDVSEKTGTEQTTDHDVNNGIGQGEVKLSANEELPARFDLREHAKAPAVPDQGTFGTCWAFASLGALESSMPETLRMQLSADHMSLQNSFGLGQISGGDYSISSAYLLAWQGPVAERDDPYGDGISPENLEPVCHLQEMQILGEKDYEAIKRAVFENGGIQSSFYMPQTDSAELEQYYNDETYAFYYDGSLEPNHDIVIIGWEDQYPKENFVNEPKTDGAFLCMNTWGESFGDRGYFFISYEDSRIGTTNISYTVVETADNYDRNYQTDLCGWTGQLGYGVPVAWCANVYTAVEDSVLEAVGFYATVPETSYRVYAVKDLDDEPQGPEEVVKRLEKHFLDNRMLVADGSVNHAGFYTIAFDEDVFLNAGERFAVIAEIDSQGAEEPVAVEYAAGERTAGVDLSDGEGYISPDGIHWQRAEMAQQCNVCLKAYANKK